MHSQHVTFKASTDDTCLIKEVEVNVDDHRVTLKFSELPAANFSVSGFGTQGIIDAIEKLRSEGHLSSEFASCICKSFPNYYAGTLDLTDRTHIAALEKRFQALQDAIHSGFRYDDFMGVDYLSHMSSQEYAHFLTQTFSTDITAINQEREQYAAIVEAIMKEDFDYEKSSQAFKVDSRKILKFTYSRNEITEFLIEKGLLKEVKNPSISLDDLTHILLNGPADVAHTFNYDAMTSKIDTGIVLALNKSTVLPRILVALPPTFNAEAVVKDLTDLQLTSKASIGIKFNMAKTEEAVRVLGLIKTLYSLSVCCRLTPDNSFKIITTLAQSAHHISALDLSNNQIDEKGASLLSSYVENTHTIQNLKLDHCHLSDKSGIILALSLKSHPSIKALCLNDNEIEDSGAVCFSFVLMVNAAMNSLHLSKNKIHDRGVIAICNALASSSTATHVHVSTVTLTAAATSALLQLFIHNKSLSEFKLDYQNHALSIDNWHAISDAIEQHPTLTATLQAPKVRETLDHNAEWVPTLRKALQATAAANTDEGRSGTSTAFMTCYKEAINKGYPQNAPISIKASMQQIGLMPESITQSIAKLTYVSGPGTETPTAIITLNTPQYLGLNSNAEAPLQMRSRVNSMSFGLFD